MKDYLRSKLDSVTVTFITRVLCLCLLIYEMKGEIKGTLIPQEFNLSKANHLGKDCK